ncbi:MAG TPA: hypothetical protein PLN52_15205 [Opitutaceae bacterium]|nr:hypothetical protein [Opitutaceae bacterium]
MERSLQTVERLIGALEELASQETILLAEEAWADVAAVQNRSAELVERLTVLMADRKVRFGLPPEVYTRAFAITEAQGIKIAQLGEWMSHTNEALREITTAQQRMRTVKPAYSDRFSGGASGLFNGQG